MKNQFNITNQKNFQETPKHFQVAVLQILIELEYLASVDYSNIKFFLKNNRHTTKSRETGEVTEDYFKLELIIDGGIIKHTDIYKEVDFSFHYDRDWQKDQITYEVLTNHDYQYFDRKDICKIEQAKNEFIDGIKEYLASTRR